MSLRPDVIQALNQLKLTKPTAIQALAIPEIVQGRNVLMAAETGTGKTLAYLAPIVSRMRMEEQEWRYERQPNRPRALILTPSKELAGQVMQVAKSLSHMAKFRVEAALDRQPHCKGHFEGLIDMVVGTPSKLWQYKDQERLMLSQVNYVVVDEADTMLEKDFGEQVRELLDSLRTRQHRLNPLQVVFSSATIPKSLNAFVDREFPVGSVFDLTKVFMGVERYSQNSHPKTALHQPCTQTEVYSFGRPW